MLDTNPGQFGRHAILPVGEFYPSIFKNPYIHPEKKTDAVLFGTLKGILFNKCLYNANDKRNKKSNNVS